MTIHTDASVKQMQLDLVSVAQERDALKAEVETQRAYADRYHDERDEARAALAEVSDKRFSDGWNGAKATAIFDIRNLQEKLTAAESRNAALVEALREQVERVGEFHGLNCLCGNDPLHRVRNHLRAALEASPAPVEKNCPHPVTAAHMKRMGGEPAPVRMVSLERVEKAIVGCGIVDNIELRRIAEHVLTKLTAKEGA